MPKATQKRPTGSTPKEKSMLALEGQLESLQVDPPDFLDESEAAIWRNEIAPLVHYGILKVTDYSSCVAYCELAAFRITELSSHKLTHLSKLRDQLGLTPAARLKIAPSAAVKKPDTIANVLKLHVS